MPFLGKEGDGVTLQVGKAYHRPCKTEPGDCGAFEGDVCQVGTTEGIIPSLIGEVPQIRSPANEQNPSENIIANHIIIGRPGLYAKDENRPKGLKI